VSLTTTHRAGGLFRRHPYFRDAADSFREAAICVVIFSCVDVLQRTSGELYTESALYGSFLQKFAAEQNCILGETIKCGDG
jgi:hypothetical protein